jgi:serine/threonine-protein kinase
MAVDADAVPAWLVAELAQDKTFADKYQVESELGFGAAGVVVAARHRVLDQRVAIKFLRSGQESAAAVARFLREARAASRIRNQHVVRIIDASTLATGIPFLVMEYLDGVDLERMLHQSPKRQLPITDAIDLVLQTCEALAECHCSGIVHRDLKPSNLFCVHGADGLPMIKVLDFGIAKLGTTTIDLEWLDGDPTVSAPRRVFGSPAYMSPEQFESSTNVDFRTDIWAIGVILYEFITGELPFAESSTPKIWKRVTEDTPRPIRELRLDSPAALAPVVLKCLEKEPSRRYASLAELAKALMPLASLRARDSVARIVRTVEAPGGDTGSLSLPPSGRTSVAPLAQTVGTRRGSSQKARVAALIAIAAAVAGGLAFNAWRGQRLSSNPLPHAVLVADASLDTPGEPPKVVAPGTPRRADPSSSVTAIVSSVGPVKAPTTPRVEAHGVIHAVTLQSPAISAPAAAAPAPVNAASSAVGAANAAAVPPQPSGSSPLAASAQSDSSPWIVPIGVQRKRSQ